MSWTTMTPCDRRKDHHHFPDMFKCIFVKENIWITIKISRKFDSKGSINNIPASVQIMAWHWSGDKPLSGPILVSLLTHICTTRPVWVNLSQLVGSGMHDFAIINTDLLNVFMCLIDQFSYQTPFRNTTTQQIIIVKPTQNVSRNIPFSSKIYWQISCQIIFICWRSVLIICTCSTINLCQWILSC